MHISKQIQNSILGIFLLFIVIARAADAQFCENDLTEQEREIVIANTKAGLYDSDQESFVVSNEIRVKWHVIGNTDNQIAIDAMILAYYLDELNTAFNPINIQSGLCVEHQVFLSNSPKASPCRHHAWDTLMLLMYSSMK